MNINEMQEKLKKELNEHKFRHSINTMKTAGDLADLWGFDRTRAEIAGLLHDCGREYIGEEAVEKCRQMEIRTDEIMRQESVLLHGKIGSRIALSDYGVDDEEILSAVSCHTMGKNNLTLLEKIIILADYIEPSRHFRGVQKARKLAKQDLDKALLYCFENTISHLISQGKLIHCDTIDARNGILEEIRNKEN